MEKKFTILVISFLLVSTFLFSAGRVEDATTSYPTKNITIVIPAGQGGANDVMARVMLASKGNKVKNQPVIVVNKPGGNEVVGAVYVAESKPDGYNLLMGWGGSTTTFARYVSDLPFDTFNDFVPIIGTASFSNCLAVPYDSPFNTLEELVAYAKENPGKLRWTYSNINSMHYLIGLDFFNKAGIDLTEVINSEGGAAARNLVAGNSVDVGIFATFLINGFEDKMKALAICDDKRDPIFNDVPLFSEAGYDVANLSECKIIAAPKGTPAEIINLLYSEFKSMLDEPSTKEAYAKQGYTIRAWNPEECMEATLNLDKMYEQIVKDFNIKPVN
ncbi:MAG: Bug family tripartite tricarboxylate transporter substrate binding protein [Peptococcales bacterium]|jgi:tripartite-type tricarboxylate transporter receptor subunit TctC